MSRNRLVYVAAMVSAAVFAAPAHARRHVDFAYPVARVWTSAVRLLRVDLESPISEKDREDGYFLFEYPHAGRTFSGSLEVVPVRYKDTTVVRVFVNVAGLPSYVERMMLTKLERKLLAEYGPPQRSTVDKREDAEPVGDGDAPGAEGPDTGETSVEPAAVPESKP